MLFAFFDRDRNYALNHEELCIGLQLLIQNPGNEEFLDECLPEVFAGTVNLNTFRVHLLETLKAIKLREDQENMAKGISPTDHEKFLDDIAHRINARAPAWIESHRNPEFHPQGSGAALALGFVGKFLFFPIYYFWGYTREMGNSRQPDQRWRVWVVVFCEFLLVLCVYYLGFLNFGMYLVTRPRADNTGQKVIFRYSGAEEPLDDQTSAAECFMPSVLMACVAIVNFAHQYFKDSPSEVTNEAWERAALSVAAQNIKLDYYVLPNQQTEQVVSARKLDPNEVEELHLSSHAPSAEEREDFEDEDEDLGTHHFVGSQVMVPRKELQSPSISRRKALQSPSISRRNSKEGRTNGGPAVKTGTFGVHESNANKNAQRFEKVGSLPRTKFKWSEIVSHSDFFPRKNTKGQRASYIILAAFVSFVHCIIPCLYRAANDLTVFGTNVYSQIMRIVYMLVSFPLMYLLLRYLQFSALQAHNALLNFTNLLDFTDPKTSQSRSADGKILTALDLRRSENVLFWLRLRRNALKVSTSPAFTLSLVVVGEALLLNLVFVATIFVRVNILAKPFGVVDLLFTFDSAVLSSFLISFILVIVRANMVSQEKHLKVLHAQRFFHAREAGFHRELQASSAEKLRSLIAVNNMRHQNDIETKIRALELKQLTSVQAETARLRQTVDASAAGLSSPRIKALNFNLGETGQRSIFEANEDDGAELHSLNRRLKRHAEDVEIQAYANDIQTRGVQRKRALDACLVLDASISSLQVLKYPPRAQNKNHQYSSQHLDLHRLSSIRSRYCSCPSTNNL